MFIKFLIIKNLMIMTSSKNRSFSEADIQTIQDAFDDPIKIQIFFKIFKNPNISSKELKQYLFTKGTRIYYYFNQLCNEYADHHAVIVSTEHKDETREHLIAKNYHVSPWMEEIVKSEKIFHLFDSNPKNQKALFLLGQKILIALMTEQLNEFEMKSEEEIETSINSLPTFNFAFITQKTADAMSPRFKQIFDELCSLEDQKKPLFERILASDYCVLLNSILMH